MEDRGQIPSVSFPAKCFDKTLSTFANWAIQKLSGFENYFLASTCHREMFQVYVHRLDAYRRSFSLHSNFIMAGQASSSKSFTLLSTVEMSIPGTIELLAHQTAKANCIEDHENDKNTWFHELPIHLLGMEGKQGQSETGDPIWKDILTSMIAKCKTFTMDERTGRRGNKTCVSEQIGVFAGATNESASRIPKALASRFAVITFKKAPRPGRELNDLVGLRLTDEKQRMKETFIDQCRVEQYLVLLVEKMIWVGLLSDVDMTIGHHYFGIITKYLEQHGITSASEPRNVTRMKNTARTLCILAAINQTFQHEMKNPADAVGTYENKAFQLRDLLSVEKYLVCTEEIVFFTVKLLEDQYVNPLLPALMKAIAKECNYTEARDQLAKYSTSGFGEERVVDYNYVAMDAGMTERQTAHELLKHLQIKTSDVNIVYLIKQLVNTSLMVQVRGNNRTDTQQRKKCSVCIWPYRSGLRISTAFLDLVLYQGRNFKDLMNDAIAACTHQYTSKRRYLSGETFLHATPCEPQFFQVMELGPQEGHHLPIYNAQWESRLEQKKSRNDGKVNNHDVPVYLLDQNFDDARRFHHWNKIGYVSEKRRRWAAAHMNDKHYVSKDASTYPDDYQECARKAHGQRHKAKEGKHRGGGLFSYRTHLQESARKRHKPNPT